MQNTICLEPIAYIRTDFKEKFGIPRQSGMVDSLLGQIIFEPKFRSMDALRGIEMYSHLWLLWRFHQVAAEEGENKFHPTVRPPRLGGNLRLGVFATRSPFRPNHMGLSCAALDKIEMSTPQGPVLWVRGADLLDQTPIYDIKPYLPYVDSYPDACGGFTDEVKEYRLSVQCSSELLECVPKEKRKALLEVLELDPRPSYHKDSERVYGFYFADMEVKFRVIGECLEVVDIQRRQL